MDHPPIITNDFLLTCLQYEYFKTNGHVRQAYKNISEMMSSKEVREEVKHRKTEDGEQDKDGSKEDVPEEEMETDEAQNSDEEEEPQEEMAMDEPMEQGPSTSTTVKTKRKLRREESTSEDSTDRSPEVKKGRLLHPEEQEHFPDEESSTSDPQSVGMRSRQSTSSDPFQFGKLNIRGSSSLSSGDMPFSYRNPVDNTDVDNDEIYIWRGEEDDQKIKTVSETAISTMFETFRSGFNQEQRIIVPRDDIVSLLTLKDISHSFIWAELTENPFNTPCLRAVTHRFDIVKSIVDFGKVKLHLSKSDTEETFEVEYWRDKRGCWIWCGDEVKFIEIFTYEILAAIEWDKCVTGSNGPLECLEFDIAERTKWSPKEQHRTFFWKKIKKMYSKKEISAKMFSVKCLKRRNVEDQPFNIRSLSSSHLESIKLRVWDDSYVFELPIYKFFTLQLYIMNMESTKQWRTANELDMNDPELDFYHPQRFTTFGRIERATITTEDVEKYGEIIKSIAAEFTTCSLLGKMDMEEFTRKYENEWHNGKYTFDGGSVNVSGTEERNYSMTIEEGKVTFNLIEKKMNQEAST